MANAETKIDLDVLNAAITAAIKAQFPQLATVDFYRLERQHLPIPACLLEMDELTPFTDPDPGTEQASMTARFSARLVIRSNLQGVADNPKQEIRKLTTAFLAFLRQTLRWPDPNNAGKAIPTGPIQIMGAYEDNFTPELDQYEVWRIEWEQTLEFGDSVWAPDPSYTIPTDVFLGRSPEVGTDYVDQYTQVIP